MNIRTHKRCIIQRSHVNVDIFDHSHIGVVKLLDTMITLNAFIPLYTFIYTDTQALQYFRILFITMELNTNTNTQRVDLLNKDGSVETFYFPITPPHVVIADNSETETEEEKDEEPEEVEEQEKEEANAEVQVEAEITAEDQDDEEAKQSKKRRRDFNVSEPTPQRISRTNTIQSNLEPLQPVSETPSIEELEESLQHDLPDLTEADLEFMMSDTM